MEHTGYIRSPEEYQRILHEREKSERLVRTFFEHKKAGTLFRLFARNAEEKPVIPTTKSFKELKKIALEFELIDERLLDGKRYDQKEIEYHVMGSIDEAIRGDESPPSRHFMYHRQLFFPGGDILYTLSFSYLP